MHIKQRIIYLVGVAILAIGFLGLPDSMIKEVVGGGALMFVAVSLVFLIFNLGLLGRFLSFKKNSYNELVWIDWLLAAGSLSCIAGGFLLDNIRLAQFGMVGIFLLIETRIIAKEERATMMQD